MIKQRASLFVVTLLALSCGSPTAGQSASNEGESVSFDGVGAALEQHADHEMPPEEGNSEASTPFVTRDPKALRLRERRVREIYQNLRFPIPVAILTGAKEMDHIFERDVVKGRVTPVGQFLEYESVVEYFYALAIVPGSRVDSVKFRSLFAGQDKVAVEVDIHFCRNPAGPCDPEVAVSDDSQTLTQVGFFQFNSADRVISMDLTILNLGKASDPPDDPAVHAAAIEQICTALTVTYIDPTTGALVNHGTCNGTFDSADDFADGFPLATTPYENCVNFMHSIPYGTWDRANSNTVTCRQLHTLLTTVDPEMHCPHTSADGGGACIDFSYASYYSEQF